MDSVGFPFWKTRPCSLADWPAKVCSLVGWFQARSCRQEVTKCLSTVSYYIRFMYLIFRYIIQIYHGCCMSTLIWWRERTPNLCAIHTCNKSRDIADPFLNSVAGFLRNKGATDRLCLVVLRCCKGGMTPKYHRNLQWNMRCRFFRHNSRTWSDPICKLLTRIVEIQVRSYVTNRQSRARQIEWSFMKVEGISRCTYSFMCPSRSSSRIIFLRKQPSTK